MKDNNMSNQPSTSENAIIRSIINYLRHLPENPDIREVRDKIAAMGAKYLCSGMYSYVYQVGKFVIKLGDDNFDKITRPLLKKEAFKKYCPTVYWIHQHGWAMVCKFVELVKIQDGFGDFIYKVSSALFADGISTWDLHRENLMLCAKTKQPLVVDYGCLIPR